MQCLYHGLAKKCECTVPIIPANIYGVGTRKTLMELITIMHVMIVSRMQKSPFALHNANLK